MKAPSARVVSTGPAMTYAERKRHNADESAPQAVWDSVESLIGDHLHIVAAALTEESPQETVISYAAQIKRHVEDEPATAAAIIAYLAVRVVKAEGITPDQMTVRHDKEGNGDD